MNSDADGKDDVDGDVFLVWSICSHEVRWTQDRGRAITPIRSNINAAYIVIRVQRDMFTTQLLV